MNKKNKNHHRKKKDTSKVLNPIEKKQEAIEKKKSKPTIGIFNGISGGLGIVDYSLHIPSKIEGIFNANHKLNSLINLTDKFADMSKFSNILNAKDKYSSLFQSNNFFRINEELSGNARLNELIGLQDKFAGLSQINELIRKQDKFVDLAKANELPSIQERFTGLNKISELWSAQDKFADLAKTNEIYTLYDKVMLNISGSILSLPSYPFDNIHNSTKSIAMEIDKNWSKVKYIELSYFTEKSLASFPWDNLGDKIGLSLSAKNKLSSSFLELSFDYYGLLNSYKTNPSLVNSLPSIFEISPDEYYTCANILEAISVEVEPTIEKDSINLKIQYENEISLVTHLPKLQSGLLNMWKGAIETYHSNNSDRTRQFITSIRELFTHIIHNLAPDNEIKNWSTEPTLYDKGRPTRKARLQFIFRMVSDGKFKKYFDKDIEATIELIDIFQHGTHRIESGFSNSQLFALKSKAETTMRFLLEIHFEINSLNSKSI